MVPIIPVITIIAEIPDREGKYRNFHFRNEDRKERFIRTLYSHRLSDIEFSVIEETVIPTRELLIELDKDPIQYAVSEVSWAKDTLNLYREKHLTDEEMMYIKSVAY